MEALINSAETLSAFADSLAEEPPGESAATEPWEWPVEGTLESGFGADPSPARRHGWVMGADGGALVTAPAAATVISGFLVSQRGFGTKAVFARRSKRFVEVTLTGVQNNSPVCCVIHGPSPQISRLIIRRQAL